MTFDENHVEPAAGPDGLQMFRSSNMGVVAYLRYREFEPQSIRFVGSNCFWFFVATKGLLSRVDEFAEGEGVVDPKEYFRLVNVTRSEFYEVKNSL